MTYYKVKTDGYLEITSSGGDGFKPFSELPRHETFAPDECLYKEVNGVTEIDYDAIANEIVTKAIYTTNAEARQYLSDTDWYIVRQTETGVAVPDEVVTLRAEARLKVV